MPDVTHVALADESNWNTGRYRSICLVSMRAEYQSLLSTRVGQALAESGVKEFKWAKLRQARERFAAEKVCRIAVEAASEGRIRIDVMTWDTEDSRHKIQGRDDIANFHRMFHHLAKNVFRTRWGTSCIWRLNPDEHASVDWTSVWDFLTHAGEKLEIQPRLETGGWRLSLKRDYAIEEVTEVSSTSEPLVQLADLFAGLAVFSRVDFEGYIRWEAESGSQMGLFQSEPDTPLAKSAACRYPIVKELNGLCKARKLGVSLASSKGFRTPNPNNPLNFWWYQPQTDLDKAPVRETPAKS